MALALFCRCHAYASVNWRCFTHCPRTINRPPPPPEIQWQYPTPHLHIRPKYVFLSETHYPAQHRKCYRVTVGENRLEYWPNCSCISRVCNRIQNFVKILLSLQILNWTSIQDAWRWTAYASETINNITINKIELDATCKQNASWQTI